jgi:cytochrome P450
LLVAGNETTRHAISGGIAALAERPDQWRHLAGERSLLETAAEEVLRWTTPVISFMRTATRPTQVRGVEVAAGDPLLLLYASANRDEDEFGVDADRFDVGRDPNHEVALGFGPHFCLGAALARIEIAAMLDALVDRFTSIEPAGDVERTASFVIAGISRAPVVCR